MGCDIHAYLDWDEFKKRDGTYYARNIAELHIGRDYLLFAIMAGVRKYGADIKTVAEPKGLPPNISYVVENEYTLYVCDDKDCNNETGICSRKEAENYIKYGSEWWGKLKLQVTHPDWHSTSWLNVEELKKVQGIYSSTRRSEPNNIAIKPGDPIPEGYVKSDRFAWANNDEELIVEEESPGLMGKHKVLESIIKMMEELNDSDVNKTRLIFWFDN